MGFLLSARSYALCLTFTLAFLGGAKSSFAQDPSAATNLAVEADLHFQRAIELYRQGSYHQALEHLLVSNRLAPNKNVVFNIARCFERIRNYNEAYRYYSDYVAIETEPERLESAQEALTRIKPQVALLRVESTPPGAKVYINRRELGSRGVTPRALALPPGEYVVLIERKGYETKKVQDVKLERGKETELMFTLNQIQGQLGITGTPRGAEIRVDSESAPIAGTVPTQLLLTPGPHIIFIRVPGQKEHVQRLVTVRAKERTTIELALRFGALKIQTEKPGARVSIDGEFAGTTPLDLAGVRAGTRKIRITRAGTRPYIRRVDIRTGQTSEVNARLRAIHEVTAASRITESAEDAPASVTLISGEEIRAFGYQTLWDALGGTRGFFQGNDRSFTFVGLRGYLLPDTFGNRYLVQFDGHVLNDDWIGASSNGFELRQDLADVEQIEIVRGPGSVLYGTNAFFGAINLVMRDADTMLSPHVSIRTDGASHAQARLGASFRLSKDAGFYLSMTGTLAQGEDLYFPEFDNGTTDGLARGLDGTRSGMVSLRAWVGELSLQLGYNLYRKSDPTASFGTIFGSDRTFNDERRGYAELRFTPKTGDTIKLFFRAYGDLYQFRGFFDYAPPAAGETRGGPVRDLWKGLWGGSEVRAVLKPTPWLRLTLGTEAKTHFQAEMKSSDTLNTYVDEEPEISVFSGYALARSQVPDWLTVSLGVRFDHFKTPGFKNEKGSAVSPRLAFIFRPTQKDTIKLIGGTAFRAPSPNESLSSDGSRSIKPAEDLKPERILTVEAEGIHRFSEEWSVVGSLYFNEIRNLIDGNQVPGQPGLFQLDNQDTRIHTLGAELELRREWRDGWLLTSSYSFQRTRVGDLLKDRNDAGELTHVSSAPAHMFAFKGAMPLIREWLQLASRLRIEAARRDRTNSLTETVLLWDIILTGEIEDMHLRYGFGVRNLFDRQYGYPGGSNLTQLSIPQPRRSFYVQVTGTL